MSSQVPIDARSMWTVFEPVHAVAYFALHVRQAFEDAGVRGFWRAYFAGRAAPLGSVGAHPIHAAFQSFTLGMVERALPVVWELIAPADAWALRTRAAGISIAASSEGIDANELAAVATVLREVAERLDPIGRPFFAAHLDLPWPPGVHEAIWHACTLLREHRGDGYVAACLVEGFTALEMMVLADRLETTPSGHAITNRGWSSEDWDACVETMTQRGLLDESGAPTAEALQRRALIEEHTDALAGEAWSETNKRELAATYDVLRGLTDRVAANGWLTYPNAVGVPNPRSSCRDQQRDCQIP